MTNLETLGMSMLKDFVESATEMGLCYCGSDIPQEVQVAVISIVQQYIDEYEEDL